MKTQHVNRVIDLLKARQPVLSTFTVLSGNYTEIASIGQSAYDMVMIENEHRGFDFPTLRLSMQALLNRGRIHQQGSLQAQPTPLVRIPVYGREIAQNQWVIKQTLDTGSYGLVLPHLDTPEAAVAAIEAARFPRPDMEGRGLRGWSDAAAEYWGMSSDEYYERADVWPLNPRGELLLVGIIENVEGVAALPAILERTRGIGLIWAGTGDLSTSMGLNNQVDHPRVEEAVQKILETCKRYGVACAASASPQCDAQQRIAQGFEVVLVQHLRWFEQVNRLSGLIASGSVTLPAAKA